MSTVLRRKCFFDVVGGTVRPQEWAVVVIENFGTMVEPFWPFDAGATTTNNDDFSSNNDFQRVDELVRADDGKVLLALNSGDVEPPLHGGRHWPRVGR